MDINFALETLSELYTLEPRNDALMILIQLCDSIHNEIGDKGQSIIHD